MSDLVRDSAQAYAAALGGEWQIDDPRFEGVRKLVKKIGDELEEAVVWRLQDELHNHLAAEVQHCAEKAIDAVLNGNEAELRRWLCMNKGSYTGRERLGSGDAHPVIHCELFECRALEVRKRIVDAYPELLKDERILDLEAQVKSLVEQVNRLTADNERLRSELRERA